MTTHGFLSCCSSSLQEDNGKQQQQQQQDNGKKQGPVLLFDVMDTIVLDPFYTMMPDHFGLTFEQVCCLVFEQHHGVEYCDV